MLENRDGYKYEIGLLEWFVTIVKFNRPCLDTYTQKMMPLSIMPSAFVKLPDTTITQSNVATIPWYTQPTTRVTMVELDRAWKIYQQHENLLVLDQRRRMILLKLAGEGCAIPWHIHYLTSNLLSNGVHVGIDEQSLGGSRQSELVDKGQEKFHTQAAGLLGAGKGRNKEDSDSDSSGSSDDSNSDSANSEDEKREKRAKRDKSTQDAKAKSKDAAKDAKAKSTRYKDTLADTDSKGKAKTEEVKTKEITDLRWKKFWSAWMHDLFVTQFAVTIRSDNIHKSAWVNEVPPNGQDIDPGLRASIACAENILFSAQSSANGSGAPKTSSASSSSSPHGQDSIVPVLVPASFYVLYAKWLGTDDGWKYTAVWTHEDRIHHIYPGTPILNCHISSLCTTDHYVQAISSPVWRALQSALREADLWSSYMHSVYHTARPPIVLQDQANAQAVRVDPTATGITTMVASDVINYTSLTADNLKFGVDEEELARQRKIYKDRVDEATRTFKDALKESEKFKRSDLQSMLCDFVFGETQREDAFGVVANVPTGKVMAPAPPIHPEASIMTAIQFAEKNISMAFNLPALMTGAEKSNFASNNQAALEVLNTSLREWGGQIEPLVAELYKFVFAEDFTRLIEDRVFATEIALMRTAGVPDNMSLYGIARIALGSMPEPDIREAAEYLLALRSETHEFLKRNIHVVAKLPFSPLNTYEDIFNALQHGVIEHPEFRKHAGRLLHLPRSDISDKDPESMMDVINPGWKDQMDAQTTADMQTARASGAGGASAKKKLGGGGSKKTKKATPASKKT